MPHIILVDSEIHFLHLSKVKIRKTNSTSKNQNSSQCYYSLCSLRFITFSSEDGSVNVYYHLGMFSSYFSVNTDLFIVLSSHSLTIFLRLLNYNVTSLFYSDFTVAQPEPTAILESFLK